MSLLTLHSDSVLLKLKYGLVETIHHIDLSVVNLLKKWLPVLSKGCTSQIVGLES